MNGQTADSVTGFYRLTPDRVMDAVEKSGMRCTGYCVALNSFENRVYEVELDLDEKVAKHERRRVIKFYRPGRWTKDQILEEHAFLQDCLDAEVPVIAPLPFPDGGTLQVEDGIFYAIFPKVGGRAPEDWDAEKLARLGRLLARLHNVGASKPFRHRLELTPDTYGLQNLEYLLAHKCLPIELDKRYAETVRAICAKIAPLFAELGTNQKIRVHGDCHPGNFLWNDQGPFFLDFDDALMAPAVQDFWLLIPGRDAEAQAQRRILIDSYRQMREFDERQLKLVEPLRALRFIHYSTWIARRFEDPAFPAAFPEFGTHAYWADELNDLEMQLRLLGT